MNKFKMAVLCPVCGKVVEADGWSLDFTTDENVILFDTFACSEFYCNNCHTNIYIGDIEMCMDYETEEEPEEDWYEDEDVD